MGGKEEKIWLDGLVFNIKSIKLPCLLLKQIETYDDIMRRVSSPQALWNFQYLARFYRLLVYISFLFLHDITTVFYSYQKLAR